MPTAFSDPVWRKSETAAAFRSELWSGGTLGAVIVGSGIMGLSTALHAARAGLSVQVLDAGAMLQDLERGCCSPL